MPSLPEVEPTIGTPRSMPSHDLLRGPARGKRDDHLDEPSRRLLVQPTLDHERLVRSLLSPTPTRGTLVHHAHPAGLARERRCEIVSSDNDVARFPGIG